MFMLLNENRRNLQQKRKRNINNEKKLSKEQQNEMNVSKYLKFKN